MKGVPRKRLAPLPINWLLHSLLGVVLTTAGGAAGGLLHSILQQVLQELGEAQVVYAIGHDVGRSFPIHRPHLLHNARMIYHVADLQARCGMSA